MQDRGTHKIGKCGTRKMTDQMRRLENAGHLAFHFSALCLPPFHHCWSSIFRSCIFGRLVWSVYLSVCMLVTRAKRLNCSRGRFGGVGLAWVRGTVYWTGVDMCATWRIRLNRPCSAAMLSVANITAATCFSQVVEVEVSEVSGGVA